MSNLNFLNLRDMAMLKTVTVSFSLFLIACQSLDSDSKSSRELNIAAGSSITLNQPLKFQVGYSRSFIQFGKPIRPADLRDRYPYCQFYRYEHPDELLYERSLQPDTFRVTKSYRAMDYLQSGSTLKLFASDLSSGGPPDDNVLANIIKIKSTKQPEIVELKCATLTEPSLSHFLTVTEIQKILGDVATISR